VQEVVTQHKTKFFPLIFNKDDWTGHTLVRSFSYFISAWK
jgi:hypothetical protein